MTISQKLFLYIEDMLYDIVLSSNSQLNIYNIYMLSYLIICYYMLYTILYYHIL